MLEQNPKRAIMGGSEMLCSKELRVTKYNFKLRSIKGFKDKGQGWFVGLVHEVEIAKMI